jgi:hypothetical protein
MSATSVEKAFPLWRRPIRAHGELASRLAVMSDAPTIDPTVPPSGDGCVECDETGGWWLHLRRCATCGHVGCCDSSPAGHARIHSADAGHPLIRSYEPDENWYWDFTTDQYYDGPALVDPQCHSLQQPTPGPAGRVPANWRDLLR